MYVPRFLAAAIPSAWRPRRRLVSNLGKDTKHVKEGLTGGGRRINRLFCREEMRALRFEPVHDHLHVAQRSGQPVDPGDDKRLASMNEVENGVELRATFRLGAPSRGRA